SPSRYMPSSSGSWIGLVTSLRIGAPAVSMRLAPPADASAGRRAIDLRREVKVAFGQPVDLVRPHFDGAAAPCDVQVRMVLLRFGDLPDSIREIEGLLEVLELERALEVTGLVQPPRAVELLEKRLRPAALERGDTAAARHTLLVRQAHDRPPCGGSSAHA